MSPRRGRRGDLRRARPLVLVVGVLVAALAVGVWVDARYRVVVTTTTTTQTEGRSGHGGGWPEGVAGVAVHRGGHRHRWPDGVPGVAVQRTNTSQRSQGSTDGADPLILGLLALAAAFIFSYVFWGRIDELSVLGLTIKLANDVAAATTDIRSRTPDDQTANQALTEFFARFFELAAKRPDLGPAEVERVKDQAIESAIDDPGAGMKVEETSEGPRLVIEHTSERGIRVTTAELLIPDTFGEDVAAKINAANSVLGRRLAAIDTSRLEVVAALSYDVDPRGSIIIEALGTLSDPADAFAAQTCATMLTEYLHALARSLEWSDMVLMRLDEEPPETQLSMIGALGFRPATEVESRSLPPGIYWRQEVS